MSNGFSHELREVDFEKIRRLIYEQCGINLREEKKELVKARLGKRLREGKFKSFGDYYKFVTTREGTDELINMIDSISTNLTFFFREESHFRKLREILPEMMRSAGPREKVKIWSAGCSTGEEPYSLAITARELSASGNADVMITATDISTRVLKTAVSGIYPKDKFNNVPQAMIRKYFQYGSDNWEGFYRAKKDLKDMIQFMRFNLMENPSGDFVFDVIFCRNVMIYFDKETQNALVNRFYNCLKKGGYFFVGHSESLTGLSHSFKYIEPSVYRR